jgi:hypothetical protein
VNVRVNVHVHGREPGHGRVATVRVFAQQKAVHEHVYEYAYVNGQPPDWNGGCPGAQLGKRADEGMITIVSWAGVCQ